MRRFAPSWIPVVVCVCAVLAVGCDSNAAAPSSTDVQAAGDAASAQDGASTGDSTTGPDAAEDAAPAEPKVEQATASGKYKVQLSGPTSLQSGQKVEYVATVIDDMGKVVPGLSLQIKFIHGQMGHGGSGLPKASDSGDGTYAITGVVPSMAGLWWLQVVIAGDKAQFDIVVK